MRSIAIFFASLAVAFAQAATAQDIPSRVGRLAYTQGPVSVYQDPDLGWDKAYVNTPITSENSVWTDRGARAEVRVGAIAVRLDGETQLDVSRLDENDLDAGVARGSINFRIRYMERDDHVTFNTPQALFIIEGDGRYRLDVDEDRDQARLTVFQGFAEMETSGGRIPVEPGNMVIVSGGQYGIERARADEFDRWADSRDRNWFDSRARGYVSNDMTGYEELDRYGSWAQDPDYGTVWYPTQVSAGWEPYRYGHWSYVRPWGWTWIDDAPWGYAPSHYGRWVLVRDRWAWAPGYTVREHPVWAPALVGFIGGAGFSVSITSGSAPVGWYPLAPWERYQPWYHASNTYATRVNHYVVDRPPRWWQGRGEEWRHINRDRGTTVVNREVFVSRRPVQSSVVRVAPEAIRSAPVVSGEAVSQRVLPQRNELARYRTENRASFNVPAPTVTRQRTERTAPQVSAAAPQENQVVRPDFRRRGSPPPVVSAPAPSAQQPHVSAPAPQVSAPAPQAQPNPLSRSAQEAIQRQEQQQRQSEQLRQQQEQAQRAARDEQQRQERASREAQQQQQRQADQQRQQQGEAQRAARESQQQQQQQAEQQRRQQAEAQRAARDEQQRQERAAREAQQQQQQQAEQQRRQQEQAQREAQQQGQRAAQEAMQRQQQQAAETQRRAQQAQQRADQDNARRQQQQQQQQQQQPQAQREPPHQQQANPAARGEDRGRGQEKKEEKKDDKKDKDKQ